MTTIIDRYDAILLDPPWYYPTSKNNMGAAEHHYDCMSDAEIAAMPIKQHCAKHAYVFVWATGPLLHRQIQMFEHWGIHYRGIAYVWVKTRKDGQIMGAAGVPPTFTKSNAELLLMGTTCKTGRPYKIETYTEPQIVLAPRGKHSAKPEVFQDSIERVIGSDKRKLELFARRQRDGWTCTGIELTGHDYREGKLI
jgi:N6-adenosine-specific RNA methylase IME4